MEEGVVLELVLVAVEEFEQLADLASVCFLAGLAVAVAVVGAKLVLLEPVRLAPEILPAQSALEGVVLSSSVVVVVLERGEELVLVVELQERCVVVQVLRSPMYRFSISPPFLNRAKPYLF